ncbi:hypothetical protein THAR02_11481 [Trichoderma harzianum]|uniref:Uncharacterized protein n=1 Tax=Trichoderma harzianum TaxID=5544 RepID=A0A0F9ZTJ7_TRIHA|nr:hypothetical protein THAR02_11481 [Trichoderma harzianum]
METSTNPPDTQNRLNPVAPGPATALQPQKEATPSGPKTGEVTVLPFTPKKKRRFGEALGVDKMPSPSFNRARPSAAAAATAAQTASRGLIASIFNGAKEATDPSKEGKSLTRNKIMNQINEINAQQRARQDVVLDIAMAIDSCLARYTSQLSSAVAEQVRSCLNTALENFIASHINPEGRPKNPEKLGSKERAAQPTETTSANTSRIKGDKPEAIKNPTRAGAPATTGKVGQKGSGVTWAQVASRGDTHNKKTQKGLTTLKNPAPSSEGPARAANKPGNETNKPKEKPDDRIFIRVPPDHAWRKLSAIGARQELIRISKLTNEDITHFQEVRSGFALRGKNQDIRNKIIALQTQAESDNLKIEEACTWKVLLVRGVPKTYTDLSGTHPTDALIPEEARVRAGAKNPPAACRKAPFGESPDTCCYFISFKEDVKPGFRLFSSSLPAETRVQPPRVTQCPRCFGFHNPRNCTRTERCRKCGKPSYRHDDTMANCSSPPQCANCNGPHTADSLKCPARPVVRNGEKVQITRTQLQAIRELGQQEYNKANPPKPKPAPAPAPNAEMTPNPGTRTGPRLRLPISSSAPLFPPQPPAQKVIVEVDSDEEDPHEETSPARSAVHVAGPDSEEEGEGAEGDENMLDAPPGADRPLDVSL